jgi:signal transduction histidine kinase
MTQVAMQSGVPDSVMSNLNEINKASCQLLRIIRDLLDFSREEDGGFKLQESEFSFEEMFWSSVDVVRFSLIEKRHKLKYEIDPSIPDLLFGDEKRLAQVISHLLENAIKFTPENGEVSFFAHLQSEDHDAVVLLVEVIDNGIGISKEQQSRIFDVFSQADESLTRKHRGVGLGLPLAQYIIGLMDGNINVISRPGKGSTFSFKIKLKKVQAPV